jgi:DNA-binding PadR family transcriptional regulator
MFTKVVKATKAIYGTDAISGASPTVGELAKACKTSYSTMRRTLMFAQKHGLVSCEAVAYKTTGKYIFSLTDEGKNFVLKNLELSL